MKKNFLTKTKGMVNNHYQKMAMFSFLLWANANYTFAQTTGDGAGAVAGVATEITKYIPQVQKLIYAIAGVVALVGAISVYIKMNNEDQDVKKSIMMVVGACIFLVAASSALPLFFGVKP